MSFFVRSQQLMGPFASAGDATGMCAVGQFSIMTVYKFSLVSGSIGRSTS